MTADYRGSEPDPQPQGEYLPHEDALLIARQVREAAQAWDAATNPRRSTP